MEVNLNSCAARHSYGAALKMKGVPTEIIKESLGHKDVRTTEIYLKSFENSVVDNADDLLFG